MGGVDNGVPLRSHATHSRLAQHMHILTGRAARQGAYVFVLLPDAHSQHFVGRISHIDAEDPHRSSWPRYVNHVSDAMRACTCEPKVGLRAQRESVLSSCFCRILPHCFHTSSHAFTSCHDFTPLSRSVSPCVPDLRGPPRRSGRSPACGRWLLCCPASCASCGTSGSTSDRPSTSRQ